MALVGYIQCRNLECVVRQWGLLFAVVVFVTRKGNQYIVQIDFIIPSSTKGQVITMETARCMEDHQINMVRQLVIGSFTLSS
jgi:hypothetical protein